MTSKPAARGAQARPPKFKKDRFDRFAWRDAVFADTEAPAAPKVLAHGIAQFVNCETGEAYPSTRELAKRCGFSQAWVRKTTPMLVALGWMRVESGSKGSGEEHCNSYWINQEKSTPCALSGTAEKSTPCALFGADRSGGKEHFSPVKGHPVCSEPPNHTERPYGPRSEYVDTGKNLTDSKTADDAQSSPDGIYPSRTPEGAGRNPDDGRVSLAASSLNQQDDADRANAAGGGAASMTPDYDERDFQFLRDIYPKPDDETASRIAFCAALRETGDVRGTVEALIETAHRYGNLVADRELEKIKTLAEFIEIGDWRNRRRAMIAANAVACSP